MYFAPFQQNAFQIIANIQNYEAFQNYQNQIPSYMLTVSQPVTDLFQWNQLFSA